MFPLLSLWWLYVGTQQPASWTPAQYIICLQRTLSSLSLAALFLQRLTTGTRRLVLDIHEVDTNEPRNAVEGFLSALAHLSLDELDLSIIPLNPWILATPPGRWRTALATLRVKRLRLRLCPETLPCVVVIRVQVGMVSGIRPPPRMTEILVDVLWGVAAIPTLCVVDLEFGPCPELQKKSLLDTKSRHGSGMVATVRSLCRHVWRWHWVTCSTIRR